MRQSGYTDAIRNRIEIAKTGSVFILSDFSDLADPEAVRKAITRLENDGTLTRVMRGVYYKPKHSEVLGENVVPSPDDVAHALARNYGWTIVPILSPSSTRIRFSGSLSANTRTTGTLLSRQSWKAAASMTFRF